MWAQYSEIGFPIVQVQMKGKIKNDEDFYDFTNGWLEYYKKKQDFVFVFDTTDVGFVKELKKQEIQYLKHSIIVTDNWWTKFLLKIIFAIQSPVCSIEYHSDFENLDLENLILKTKGRDSLGLQ